MSTAAAKITTKKLLHVGGGGRRTTTHNSRESALWKKTKGVKKARCQLKSNTQVCHAKKDVL
jgi:hypothetical protein